jgi:AraC-like DNA-binding protein
MSRVTIGRMSESTRTTSARARADQRLRDLAALRRVRDRMDREYAQPLDVEALARGAHMSAGHLSREFRAAFGESPYGYLMTRRVERAMALLRRGDVSVTEACFAVGCSSLGTFSTRFRELVGTSPSEYRRRAMLAVEGVHVEGLPACVAKQVTRPVREASRHGRTASRDTGPQTGPEGGHEASQATGPEGGHEASQATGPEGGREVRQVTGPEPSGRDVRNREASVGGGS